MIARNSEDVLTQLLVEVPAAGLNDLVVPIAQGVAMQGRILFDGKSPRPPLMDIWLSPTSGGESHPADWGHDGVIRTDGLLRDGYALRVSQNGTQKWFVQSMRLGGVDLTTRPLEVSGTDITGVEVTMTDRPSSLSGTIVDAKGAAVRDATVVVFPVERAAWATGHDDLERFARTRSLDGKYRFPHLVPGDYFVAAVDERQMGDWPRADFLEAVAKQASPVRITAGDIRTLPLALQTR